MLGALVERRWRFVLIAAVACGRASLDDGPAFVSVTSADFVANDCGVATVHGIVLTNGSRLGVDWDAALEGDPRLALDPTSRSGTLAGESRALLTIDLAPLDASTSGGDLIETQLVIRRWSGAELLRMPVRATANGPHCVGLVASHQKVVVSPPALDFGKVSCGATGSPLTLTVTSQDDAPFDFHVTLAKGTTFDVMPTNGTLQPGASRTIVVTPAGVPSTSALTDNLYGDTLRVVTTSLNDAPHDVDLRQSASGAILHYTLPASIDFGRVQVDAPTAQTFAIENAGNVDATVIAKSPTNAFSMGPTVVPAGTTIQAPLTFSPLSSDIGVPFADVVTFSTETPTCADSSVAVPATGTPFDRASQVACSFGTVCALSVKGRVYCWGGNGGDQLGFMGPPLYNPRPVSVPGLPTVTMIGGLSYGHTALTSKGDVVDWGVLGNTFPAHTPTSRGLNSAVSLLLGVGPACAIVSGGGISCWGDNSFGELGNGTTTPALTPTAVSSITNANKIAGSATTACAVLADGTIACWGDDWNGELGDGKTGTYSTVPVAVLGVTNAVDVAVGSMSACAVLSDGTVMCWGGNGSGEVGQPLTVKNTTALTVAGVTDATSIASGSQTMCALRKGGGVQCWGSNWSGTLGNGDSSMLYSYVPMNVSKVSSGTALCVSNLGCVVHSQGMVSCWGANSDGALGNGKQYGNAYVPGAVLGFD